MGDEQTRMAAARRGESQRRRRCAVRVSTEFALWCAFADSSLWCRCGVHATQICTALFLTLVAAPASFSSPATAMSDLAQPPPGSPVDHESESLQQQDEDAISAADEIEYAQAPEQPQQTQFRYDGSDVVAESSDDEGNEHTPLRPAVVPAGASPPPSDLSAIGVWRNTAHHIHTNASFQLNSGTARIALLGVCLGIGLGVGSQWIMLGFHTRLFQLGLYLLSMCLFHLLEFVWTAIFHPQKLSAQSYLLNHSREYHLALAAGIVEFAVESWMVPSIKYPHSAVAGVCMWIGLALVVGGQAVRTLAMLTAADNFTHIVAESRRPSHILVTHGIYSLVRHPSYAGWFWWSVGTQILLGNPLCTVGYAVASWLFFRGRIAFEERAMIGFFGTQYTDYQKRVPSGVPGIKGYGQ